MPDIRFNRRPVLADPEETAAVPRPCAFYQAAMQPTAPHARRAAEGSEGEVGSLQHRCLLTPGKNQGPDGKAISLSECTLERQAQCQIQRRAALSRLHATLPALRVTPPAQAAGG